MAHAAWPKLLKELEELDTLDKRGINKDIFHLVETVVKKEWEDRIALAMMQDRVYALGPFNATEINIKFPTIMGRLMLLPRKRLEKSMGGLLDWTSVWKIPRPSQLMRCVQKLSAYTSPPEKVKESARRLWGQIMAEINKYNAALWLEHWSFFAERLAKNS